MITRRGFLKAGVSGLGLFFTEGGVKVLKAFQSDVLKPFAWANITRDNYLVVVSNKSEMGQGVHTGLSMLVADELNFPWERVRVQTAPAGEIYIDRKMGSQLTGGSTSLRNMHTHYRLLGATIREMLLLAASSSWKVPKESLRIDKGYVTDGKRKVSCGELWEIAIKLPVPQNPRLKTPKEFIYIGKNVPRIDVPEKVEGKAIFGIDVRLDGMVYALVERPPSFGSKLLSYDVSKAKKVDGFISAFPISTGLAICANSFESALKARQNIEVSWSKSPIQDFDDEKLKDFFLSKLQTKGQVARREGDPERVIQNSGKKVEAVYLLPYLYHATLEPMNCVAYVKEDECIVYAPIQGQTFALNLARSITGLPEDRIKIYTTYLGGGFGRKAQALFVGEAIEISKKLRKPVKLVYTREDDVKSGYYRPMNATLLRGAVDDKGKVSSLYFKIAVQSVFEWAGRPSPIDRAAVEGLENIPYQIPNLHVEYVKVDLPVSVWFWRSVGSTHNAFTLETFIDRLAKVAGRDPVDLRLELLKDPRAKKVVEVAAEKGGWGKKSNLGLAYHYSFGSHVAQVAEVSFDEKNSELKVHKVVCAIDLGPFVIHPGLVISQVEGAIMMGLSAALKEGVKFSNGGPSNLNFDTYPLLTMDEAPEVEVYIVKGDGPMGGVGEPGLPPVAPAVANALLWGYGIEVNQLPMTPDVLKSAISRR
ncbi:xanthine dehydrogenase family protein molybdopterin-binding subunit [Thermocrinis minervae]|uniref:Isoquinoline 1-oxidoreductase, beta subunit n=1 Tax=Thermocrinis minervae TaxID=381751 RepID=A0A1M6TAU5_9AQUI|nr:xanthine dehydrogenase family protein molybdopterin-binding subunit [Thermocrinis minervae]SHK53999.1 isoquinoline 1-oxidoreductase, beta subunit [Thermocrinis minervae]